MERRCEFIKKLVFVLGFAVFLVPKPLPMSVFIHDAKEQVKYKSMLINASIAKARDTWTHPILQNDHDDIMKSEEMPFLRTPTIDLKDKKYDL